MGRVNTIIKSIWILLMVFIVMTCGYLASTLLEDGRSITSFNNIDELEAWVGNHFTTQRQSFVELYGLSNKVVGREAIGAAGTNFITLNNGAILFPCESNDMKFQIYGMKCLSDVCLAEGVNLLYVNCPMKPENDAELSDIGYPSFFGLNTKLMLDGLNSENIDVLDMREVLTDIDSDFYSWFYKTEHHWTTPAGFICAKSIVEYLDTVFNKDMDVKKLQADNFVFDEYKEAWLGENGRKLSRTYSGLDNYTFIYPKFETHLNYNNKDGDFGLLVQQENFLHNGVAYNLQNVDLYNQSLHYSYLPDGAKNDNIHNYDSSNDTKILIVKDSFGIPVVPFVSLSCADTYIWDNRTAHEMSLIDYIKRSNFDAVVVMYCEGSIYRPEIFDFVNAPN